MRGVFATVLGAACALALQSSTASAEMLAIAKAIAGMSGRFIISALSLASPFTPTIGDGLSTSTKGTAGVNMRAAVTGVKAAGSKSTKTW